MEELFEILRMQHIQVNFRYDGSGVYIITMDKGDRRIQHALTSDLVESGNMTIWAAMYQMIRELNNPYFKKEN